MSERDRAEKTNRNKEQVTSRKKGRERGRTKQGGLELNEMGRVYQNKGRVLQVEES